MVRKEELSIFFMVLAVALVLISDASLTASAITVQETSPSVQLCQAANLEDRCITTEIVTSSGKVTPLELTAESWDERLRNFGVNCSNIAQGKLSLGENDELLEVDIIIGKGGGTCTFNGVQRKLPEGSRIIYTPKDITALLALKSSGFFSKSSVTIPKMILSEVFPSASQESTIHAVKVCFDQSKKLRWVVGHIKNSKGVEVKNVQLYDDGAHLDGGPVDGCWGTTVGADLPSDGWTIDYDLSL